MFVFDQSSNHCAFSSDALNPKKMNVGPGGKNVPVMHSTTWNGQPQEMVLADGQPKGLRKVLQVNTKGLIQKQMVAILSSHHDFLHEKCKMEKVVTSFGHKILFLPKFHCLIPLSVSGARLKCTLAPTVTILFLACRK